MKQRRVKINPKINSDQSQCYYVQAGREDLCIEGEPKRRKERNFKSSWMSLYRWRNLKFFSLHATQCLLAVIDCELSYRLPNNRLWLNTVAASPRVWLYDLLNGLFWLGSRSPPFAQQFASIQRYLFLHSYFMSFCCVCPTALPKQRV